MSFEQTPLFQLNLMIFLGWPSPPEFVSPVLHEDGFQLLTLGLDISTTIQNRARATNAIPPIPFQLSASPDLLFIQNNRRALLPIECKIKGFSPEAGQAKQAASLLSFTGTYIANFIGLSNPQEWDGVLVYTIGERREQEMLDTLLDLKKRLMDVNISTSQPASWSIDIRDDGVYLVVDPRSSTSVSSFKNSPEGLKVMDLIENEDPRTLYLLPLDPSYRVGDEYEQHMLEERIRSALVSLIGGQLDQPQFDFQFEDVMHIAIEVWDVLAENNAKKNLRDAVRSYCRDVFQQLRKLNLDIDENQGEIFFKNITSTSASQAREYLTGMYFRKGKIDVVRNAIQLELEFNQEESGNIP